jgi:hypothetical protein
MVWLVEYNGEEYLRVRQFISERLPQYSHVDDIRFLGRCPACGKDTFYCCYKGFSGGMSCRDDFLHVCISCYTHKFDSEQQQESMDSGLEAAVCPFCGYNWSMVWKDRENAEQPAAGDADKPRA